MGRSEIEATVNYEDRVQMEPSFPLVPPETVVPRDEDLERGSSSQPQCRICLESDGRDFIAPCKCKGSSKYVHRDCLDKWRTIKEGFAFSHCTTCKMRYHLRVQTPKDRRWRLLKFRFFVTRDILVIGLSIQSIIISLAYAVFFLDNKCGKVLRHSWKVESVASFYYICGLTLFFILFGFFGCFCTCYDRRFRSNIAQPCHDCFITCCGPLGRDCAHPGLICWLPDCTVCADGFAASSAECISASSGAAGEMGAIVIVSAAIVAIVVLSVVGVFYSLIVATLVGQRVWQRHYHLLAKQMLTKEYLVEDLDGELLPSDYQPPPLPQEHSKQLHDLGLM